MSSIIEKLNNLEGGRKYLKLSDLEYGKPYLILSAEKSYNPTFKKDLVELTISKNNSERVLTMPNKYNSLDKSDLEQLSGVKLKYYGFDDEKCHKIIFC